MVVYAIVMFFVAAICLIVGIAIRKGNTYLINMYHQTRVKETDRPQYGKEFSNGLFILCVAMLISGIVSLLGESKFLIWGSIAILFAGVVLSTIIFVKVQKKYNGGIS